MVQPVVRSIKLLVYRMARTVGLFRLARWLTRDRLRILAYHGFSNGEVVAFRPKLFITPETFARRMALLRRRGFAVQTLDEAVRRLRNGEVDGNAVVVTIDDGYASTLYHAAPILARYRIPATVYVTSYYVEHQTPVFDLVVGFMLWKTACDTLVLSWPRGAVSRHWSLASPRDRERCANEIIALGRAAATEGDRVSLCDALGGALAVPYDRIVAEGDFRLMTPGEIGQLRTYGIEVGLHTHRHRFPIGDDEACRREIDDNEARLRRWVELPARHFCYPSGVYAPSQWGLLERCGVASSTTCDVGLVTAGDPCHGLKRFLDGEMVSEVEFDAELCGFSELLRGALQRRQGKVSR